MSDSSDAIPRGVGRPATAAFALAGYTRLSQFAGAREADLVALHGVGPKAIRVLREAMAEAGYTFADPKENQRRPAT